MVSRRTFFVTVAAAVLVGVITGYVFGTTRVAPPGEGTEPAATETATISDSATITQIRDEPSEIAQVAGAMPSQPLQTLPTMAEAADSEVLTDLEQLEPLRALMEELWQLDALQPALAAAQGDDFAAIESELRELVSESPALLAELIERYRAAPPGPARDLLHSLLAQTQSGQVEAFALDLLVSGDAAAIRDGLGILRDGTNNGAAARAAILDVLQTQQDETLIRAALQALHPALVTPTERRQIAQLLESFATDGTAAVRAAGIEALAEWSGTGDSTDFVLQGLKDDAPGVREAAAFAASVDVPRSDEIRDELLQIVASTDEEWSVRHHAFNALGRYTVPDDAYATLQSFEQELLTVYEDAAERRSPAIR